MRKSDRISDLRKQTKRVFVLWGESFCLNNQSFQNQDFGKYVFIVSYVMEEQVIQFPVFHALAHIQ